MKKIISIFTITIVLISCKESNKGVMADNKGPNDGKETYIPNSKKDTINVLEYIEIANEPQQRAAGGATEKIESKKIIKYDDNNPDTILATIHYKGIIHPPTTGNPPPSKPFERIEKYQLFKVNGNWKAVKK